MEGFLQDDALKRPGQRVGAGRQADFTLVRAPVLDLEEHQPLVAVPDHEGIGHAVGLDPPQRVGAQHGLRCRAGIGRQLEWRWTGVNTYGPTGRHLRLQKPEVAGKLGCQRRAPVSGGRRTGVSGQWSGAHKLQVGAVPDTRAPVCSIPNSLIPLVWFG